MMMLSLPLMAKPRARGGTQDNALMEKAQKKEKAQKTSQKAALSKAIRMESGKVCLDIMKQKGVWRLYVSYGEDKKTAVLSEYDEGASSGFFLLLDRAQYALNSFGGAETQAIIAAGKAEMNYSVGSIAKATVTMTTMKSTLDAKDDDIIKVQVTVKNLKKKKAKVALKGVFDTVLEEKASGALFTKAISKVTKETQLLSMEKDKWVCSTDGERAVQFLLFGADITAVEAVTLANGEIIGLPLWTPVISAMRSFDNVLSYNNSALCINWPQVELGSGETSAYTFYIALTEAGGLPNGEAFIKALEGNVPAMPAAPVSSPKKDVLFDAVLDEKVDPEYMRALIKRINALENDGSNTNVEELLQLNKELDRVLDILKSKR